MLSTRDCFLCSWFLEVRAIWGCLCSSPQLEHTCDMPGIVTISDMGKLRLSQAHKQLTWV